MQRKPECIWNEDCMTHHVISQYWLKVFLHSFLPCFTPCLWDVGFQINSQCGLSTSQSSTAEMDVLWHSAERGSGKDGFSWYPLLATIHTDVLMLSSKVHESGGMLCMPTQTTATSPYSQVKSRLIKGSAKGIYWPFCYKLLGQLVCLRIHKGQMWCGGNIPTHLGLLQLWKSYYKLTTSAKPSHGFYFCVQM